MLKVDGDALKRDREAVNDNVKVLEGDHVALNSDVKALKLMRRMMYGMRLREKALRETGRRK